MDDPGIMLTPNRLVKYCEDNNFNEENPQKTVELENKKPPLNIIGYRTCIAFWILGLCNNYGYVVMLTAAHDILSDGSEDKPPENNRHCNTLSTGAILLADIIPSLAIKLIAPFFPLFIHFRMVLTLILAAAGFILVAESNGEWVAISGVICTALSSGLGEATLLSYMAFYKNKNVISTWSSGTGGAGFFGSMTYTTLTVLNFSKRTTLYLLLLVPTLMGFTFWVILEKPDIKKNSSNTTNGKTYNASQSNDIINDCDVMPLTETTQKFLQKLYILPSLLKFMIPLGLVYFFEYLINQGLFELVQFDNSDWSYKTQYKWYQVDYQIGVFISRSSINLFKIDKTWILALFQFLNLIVFATEAIYGYIPHIAIIMGAVFWEGLLGGAAYVNTYHRISKEVSVEKQEFAMAFTSLSDAIGISLAGFVAMPVHNYICQLPKSI